MISMFETMITGEGTVIKGCHSDLDSALEQLFSYLDKPMNGYVVDSMTGEVLASLNDGMIDYISEETQKHMLSAIAEDDPGLVAFIKMMLIAIKLAAEEERSEELDASISPPLLELLK